MSKPVAIVTGAASGIGLAVSKHLLSKGYRVAMADVNAKEGERLASELGDDALFHQADVSVYAQQAALFQKAFAWGGGRLDFLAANAGIDDRQSLYETEESLDEDGIPKPLNLKTVEVDLVAVFQGVWLFKHFARKGPNPGGKVVITSSAAGFYPMDSNPQYCAAKHGLVGLTRSCGPVFLKENITVNCICPAFVPTNLCPPHMLAKFPKEHITPMTTVLKAFETFLGDDAMTGQTVELSIGDLFFRQQIEYPNESQKALAAMGETFWAEAYESVPPARNGV
ncbi:putative 15-hydroxyprostaglandin dehydrogenase (nad(+)) protein [Neofusicoccum parvum UCRNP2]|uniref:Putative 15-hydroxyprostaglandin dehydrogenase (Nad(+)) protein n=1 Tax=Botryosphaeria parva (strain UCR-NP2) TaxID=1287680 RepID=R1G5C3_BOTPV|nr:putative 15-hydroxyprostaglandin dehydrogenase (nad(+)) protein [Neofusicoccum parvum UCRNP2]